MANVKTKDGTELTPEQVEKLAQEAERGYDLSKARRRRRGRPALNGRSAQAKRITFRADDTLFDLAHRRARREGRTVSDIAREAVERYVKG